jgi:hypothetical protein
MGVAGIGFRARLWITEAVGIASTAVQNPYPVSLALNLKRENTLQAQYLH